MIRRLHYLQAVEDALAENPVCALLGPRQCGKTTLARQFAASSHPSHYFDLETAAGRARLSRAELTLAPLKGLVVIDEIQRQPELFAVLRPLVDRPGSGARFLILGSASPELVRGVSESLAGRVGFVDLSGFHLGEVGSQQWRKLWLRGGFPRSFLARTEAVSLRWRLDFVRTFLERDIPQLGIRIPAETLRRFWMMVAHYHGQIWNGAELARSLGTSEHTVRGYLDLLTGTFILRQLQPWFENIGKRQYKSPKVYVRDSGLLHALMSIERSDDLECHPKYGASWEGFALEQVLSVIGGTQVFYWGTHAGAELDLLFFRRGRRYGVEFKAADAPEMTKSLRIALSDLQLERAWLVYPGSESYAVHERVDVLPLGMLLRRLSKLGG
ncbi:MAG TPA: ATP-binding protein [Candidatus Obscuribacterales bacterium]